MNCPQCEKPMFRASGNCGSDHFICIPCDLEWCTLFKEEEHLDPDPEGRRLNYPAIPEPKTKPVRKKPKKKENRFDLYKRIIMEADNFLGDIMGELAETQYSEKGGSVGMVEGRFELSNEEIKDCMFEALALTDNHGKERQEPWGKGFDLEGLRIDRKKLVDFWYKQNFK